jgi:hypothetical protein
MTIKLLARLCLRPTSRDHRYIAIESGTVVAVVVVVVVVIGNPRHTGHEKTDVYELRPGTRPGPMETTKCEEVLISPDYGGFDYDNDYDNDNDNDNDRG